MTRTALVVVAFSLLPALPSPILPSGCPSLFPRIAGRTECLVDYDAGSASLVLYSHGLPDYWVNPERNIQTQDWAPEFPLRPQIRSALDGPLDIATGDLVGFATNGVRLSVPWMHGGTVVSIRSCTAQVPFIKAPMSALQNQDGCLGMVQPGSGAYYYATAPPCLINPGLVDSAANLDSIAESFYAGGFPSPLIGYALGEAPKPSFTHRCSYTQMRARYRHRMRATASSFRG